MAPKKRTLGSSGIEITTVGLGTWAIGGGGWLFGWGQQDDAASIAAIRRGVELGINWIDTAAIYGLGHSEEMVGRALAGIPSARKRRDRDCTRGELKSWNHSARSERQRFALGHPSPG